MFGLSLTKLLFTILIAVAVWKGFMMIGRLAREREVQAVRDKSKGRARAAGTGTIELVECPAAALTSTRKQGLSLRPWPGVNAQTARFLDRLWAGGYCPRALSLRLNSPE